MMRRRLLVLLAGAAVSQRIDRARDYPTTPVTCEDRTHIAAGSAAAGRPSDGAGAAARYYPAAGDVLRRLPGAVPGRRRRAAVLQGARLRRVRERGRGDRHVPVLRRGPVAGGLFQRRAIAVAGGLLQRRGDRARAFEELGVIRKQYLETIVN